MSSEPTSRESLERSGGGVGSDPGIARGTVATSDEAAAGTPVEGVGAGQVALVLATLALFLGALAIRSGLVFGIVVLAAVLIPIEKVFALHRQRVFRPRWATDLVHFVVNNLLTSAALLIPVAAVGTILRVLVPASLRSSVTSQAIGWQLLEALVLSEFFQYGAHRATHSVPWLWRFHKVHHSMAEMDWLASGRLHPIDSVFMRSCVILPLYALGFSRASFGGLLAITAFQAIFIHANVRFTFGPLRWLVATPAFHHWHHTNDVAHRNTNFAGEFPWIDALFGTLYLPKGEWPATYGIDEPTPDGYLRQLAWSFKTGSSV